mgnify:CR=1 FL=1
MTTTVISIIIILVILSIFLFINFDYKAKYKKGEKDLYYEALDLLLLGKRKEAYATLLALIKNDTENVKAYLKLGQVLREIGKPDRALKVHRSLLIRTDLTNYEKIELYKSISLDYKELNNIHEAINQCKKIIKVDKNNEWALLELVELYKGIDDWNSSKGFLQTYQKITGNVDSRIIGLYIIKQGIIELGKNEFIKSRSLFEEGLNLDNQLAISYKLMGDAYSKESEIEYQNSEDGDNPEQVKKAKELLSSALSMWIKYAQNKPSCSKYVLSLIKDSLFALDRYSELEFILKDLIDRDSNNIDALINLADYYSNQGENQKSIELLDSLHQKDKSGHLVKMLRLKLKIHLDNSLSDVIRDDFDEITKEMLNTSDDTSLFKMDDEDLKWLSENEAANN